MAEHECVIGMYNNYEDTDLITYSEICEKSLSEWSLYLKHEEAHRRIGLRFPTWIEDYFDKRKSTELTRFTYCPECGKKIDWRELKRKASLLPKNRHESV